MTNTNQKPLSKNNLGLNLYNARISKNMSILDLAVEIEVSERIISYYESGEKFPSLDTIIKLANALEVSLDNILR